ncbi:MAG TPA: hypothetical protein ENK57_22010 [Polyangiaceae bacterium]|nr:hypothetical protein [Polyangiaceae bacterium]
MRRSSWVHRVLFTFGALTLAVPLAAAQEADAAPPSVREMQVGTHLEAGLVAAPQTTISRDAGRIYAVVRLNNPSRQAGSIRVALERVGGPHQNGFSLEIPARRRYRTVARFGAAHPPGRYRIVVRTEGGTELESVEITITE